MWGAFELGSSHFWFNPLTLMSDQGRISPYNINTESSRLVRRMKKKYSIRELQVDPIPNSPNWNKVFYAR